MAYFIIQIIYVMKKKLLFMLVSVFLGGFLSDVNSVISPANDFDYRGDLVWEGFNPDDVATCWVTVGSNSPAISHVMVQSLDWRIVGKRVQFSITRGNWEAEGRPEEYEGIIYFVDGTSGTCLITCK